MSFDEEPIDPAPDPALRHALDQWHKPQPRAQFRERARAEFLSTPFEAPAASEAVAQELDPLPIVAPRWGGASTSTGRGAERNTTEAASRPWLTLLTIAAAAAAVLLISRWPAPSQWSVADSSDFVLARVDGREFTPGETSRLAAALHPRSIIEVEGGSLDLVLDRRLALSVAAGGALTLMAIPEPEVLADLWLTQERGSLAIVTGPAFPGSSLRIQTPDTEVRIVGTRFAVDIIAGQGTCVCCSEGSVAVFEAPLSADSTADEVEAHTVAGGGQRFVFRDRRPMEIGQSMPAHVAPLEALRRIWPGER